MARSARSPDQVARPYAPERFEYRIWGTEFAALPAPDDIPESAEVYLLPEREGINAKFRHGALEIKRLLGVRHGLQRWLPALRCALPLPAGVIEAELCPALGVAAPPLARRHYELAELLAEVVPGLPGVHAIDLRKRRRQFAVKGARAERTRVVVRDLVLESAAVEAEHLDQAARAADRLALRRADNLDYVTVLRRILAGWQPDAAA